MLQILNITQTRNNLSSIVSRVASEKKEVIIIRDSQPEAVLIPYSEYILRQEHADRAWRLRFEQVLAQGKQSFRAWAKTNNINLKNLREEDVYDFVEKA